MTAAITALFAMALAAAVAGRGCNNRSDGATDAVRSFVAAAASGDRKTIVSAFKTLGESCKGCHESFREDDDH
jgi:hypothetical protein